MNNSIYTVNFHLIKYCNLRCKFCYAHFANVKKENTLPIDKAYKLIKKLKENGSVKINFAGGEPFLYRDLGKLIKYAYQIGLKTSVVTNANFITEEWLNEYGSFLHWVAISCDSAQEKTLKKLGRGTGDQVAKVRKAFQAIKDFNYSHDHSIRTKLNSVITSLNWEEDMSDFVRACAVERWKVLQVLPIEGENDRYYSELAINCEEFAYFLEKHQTLQQEGIEIAGEDNDAMTNSYVMINPEGKFYQNNDGRYIYSDPILEIGVKEALTQVGFSEQKFFMRGGFYNY